MPPPPSATVGARSVTLTTLRVVRFFDILVCTLQQKPLSLRQKITAMTTTLQIDVSTPEAVKFIEFARTLPFVSERRAKQKEDIRPMTMEEFNAEIDGAMEDLRAGRVISSAELKKRMASW
jgi:hypothetical protein